MKSKLTGIWWLLFWGLMFLIAVLAVDLVYTLWPYPNGARGSVALAENVQQEWRLLIQLGDERFVRLAYRIHDVLYQILFVFTGVDFLIQGAGEASRGTLDDLARRAVISSSEVWLTAAAGLQLFASRLAVFLLCLPIMILTLIGAGADGLISWYRRRSGGGRESGFLYHRAKRAMFLITGLLAAIYLIPPVVMDPRWIFPTGLFGLAVAARTATAYFKKYL